MNLETAGNIMKENTFIYSSNVVHGQVTTNAESRAIKAISGGSNSETDTVTTCNDIKCKGQNIASTEVVNQRQVTADAKRGAADGALHEFLICVSGGCNISTSTNPGNNKDVPWIGRASHLPP